MEDGRSAIGDGELVAAERFGPSPRTTADRAGDAELFEEGNQRRRVTGLPGRDFDDEREPALVGEMVKLARPAAARAADA